MPNHLTPTELARESGLERREVLTKCLELGVPIFQGRIDKSLFLANLHGLSESQADLAVEHAASIATPPGISAASAA